MGSMLAARFVITGLLEKGRGHSLRVQVHRTPSGRILFSYRKSFNDEGGRIIAVRELADRITRDILRYGDMPLPEPEKETKEPPVKKPPQQTQPPKKKKIPLPVRLGLDGAFILPAGHFRTLVNDGYGIMVSGETSPLGASSYFLVKNIFFGIRTGYQSFTGRVNSKDRAVVVPALATAGLQLPLTSLFAFRFTLGAGITWVNLSHAAGAGFDMPDNSSASSIEAAMEVKAALTFTPFRGLYISTGWFYSLRFEASRPVHTTGLAVGAIYCFHL